MGKSTSLKHISLAWANGESSHLKQFDFVFHVALKFVKKNQTLEHLIVQQHKALKRQKVSPTELLLLLEGKTDQNVLLLLDGYDEYKKATSKSVEDALTKEALPHCCVLLTSRDNRELAELKPYMDVEAEITGFDPERVKEYIRKYLGSGENTDRLIHLAEEKNLLENRNSIMQVPIFLHMICVLFQRKVSLPRTRTGIISAIVERCPDWEEIRKSGKKTDDEWKVALETALIHLGELSFAHLEQDNEDLIFEKVSFVVGSRKFGTQLFFLMFVRYTN